MVKESFAYSQVCSDCVSICISSSLTMLLLNWALVKVFNIKERCRGAFLAVDNRIIKEVQFFRNTHGRNHMAVTEQLGRASKDVRLTIPRIHQGECRSVFLKNEARTEN